MSKTSRFKILVDSIKLNITEISQEDLHGGLNEAGDDKEKFLLIDVREAEEFAREAIPTAVHASRGVIETKIEAMAPDLNQSIVVYCGGGSRSALVADNLQKMGYTQVRSLAGGFRGWQNSKNK